jgi:hypothetical protein
MPKRPRKSSANVRRLKRPPTSDARYEIVFQSKPWERPAFRSLLAELQSLIARSGSAVGDAYARLAGSLLNRIEGIEDANAERKFRQRSQKRLAAPADAVASQNTTPKRSIRSV